MAAASASAAVDELASRSEYCPAGDRLPVAVDQPASRGNEFEFAPGTGDGPSRIGGGCVPDGAVKCAMEGSLWFEYGAGAGAAVAEVEACIVVFAAAADADEGADDGSVVGTRACSWPCWGDSIDCMLIMSPDQPQLGLYVRDLLTAPPSARKGSWTASRRVSAQAVSQDRGRAVGAVPQSTVSERRRSYRD
jgi:hypothetical protein